MPPRQTLKVAIYAGAGDPTRDFSHASIQRSSLCALLAASALSQNGFSVTLVGPQDIQKGEGITISLTSSLRRLLNRLHLLADHDGDATTLDLHDLRARVLTKVNEEAQLFRYIATDSPASFDTSSSASSPTLLLADGTSVKNEVLLCCDPSPSVLSSCVSLPSSPSQVDERGPILLFYDVPWSVTHRAISGPAAYSVGNEERQSPSSLSALDLSQWLLDALSLSFVLTQAAVPHAVGVALQVYSDVRREHLRSLAELTETGERLDEETLEDFLDKDWLAQLEDSWSRRYLSNI